MTEERFAREEKKWAESLKDSMTINQNDAIPLELEFDSISRDGLIKIKFNQEILVPSFIMETENVVRRLLSSLESINVSSFMSIFFVMKSDVDPSDIEYYLILEKWERDELWVRINFTEPLLVSRGN
jgi:hypothetical protein